MIIDVFADAFRYASRDNKTLLKLAGLAFFSFLIIPLFLLAGYSLRVVKIGAKGVINGADPLPDFKNLKSMFVDGAKLIAVKIIYLIIPFLFLIAAHFTFIMNNHLLVLLLLVVGGIIFIIQSFFYYLAIPAMAITGNFSEAFKFKLLYKKMKSISLGNYIRLIIVLILVELAIGLTASYILNLIFDALGIVISFTGNMTINATISAILINAIFIVLIYPFCMLIKSRCVGLIYTIGD